MRAAVISIRRFGHCLALAILAGLTSTPILAATLGQWQNDLTAIVEAFETTHPDPFARIGEERFRRDVFALRRAMPHMSEAERTVGLMQLVASLRDGHSQLDPVGDAYDDWYPIRIYEFADGVYIVNAHRSVAELAGARIESVNGIAVSDALTLARTVRSADNRFQDLENTFGLSNATVAQGLGLADADSNLPLVLLLRNGTRQSVTLEPVHSGTHSGFDWRFRSEVYGLFLDPEFNDRGDWITAYDGLTTGDFREVRADRPLHLNYRRHYYATSLPEQNAYYAQINFVANDGSEESFNQFFERILDEVAEQRPEHFILDWRYNSGGDGSMMREMINDFIAQGDDPPWGELYFLVGRKTYSASIMALAAFRDHVPATYIGEPAGAALNHYGDAETISLPDTGLRLTVSTLRWQLAQSDNYSRYVPIDVPAQFSFEDYVEGRDPAVDAILSGLEMRSLVRIVEEDGAAAVRAAYEDRVTRFGELDWWIPGEERTLNSTGYDLLSQDRIEDSLEIFRINTEIFPASGNVWDSYGEALMTAGRRTEALVAYRRSLELNPGNDNAAQILAEANQ